MEKTALYYYRNMIINIRLYITAEIVSKMFHKITALYNNYNCYFVYHTHNESGNC